MLFVCLFICFGEYFAKVDLICKKLIENIFKQFFKLIVIVHKSENGSVIIYSAEEHYLVDKRQCGKLVFAEIIFLSDYTE